MGVILIMKLTEIAMDLPYQKNEKFISIMQENKTIEYQEVLKMDYELNWKEKRREFQLMTRCMTSMIGRIMSPIITKDCWKILIECVSDQEYEGYHNLLGVYTIQVETNLDVFYSAADYDKKKLIIDIILRGIQKLSNNVSFELSNLTSACVDIVNGGYINEWLWGKMRLGKNVARIKVQHEISELNLFMSFFDQNNMSIKEELIISTIPDEWVYGKYLGQLIKISEDTVALIDKYGKEVARVSKTSYSSAGSDKYARGDF